MIKKFSCDFKVYKHRDSSKIISLSLWKASPSYVFNLATTITWWARNCEVLFPDWNVRIHVDNSLLRKYYKNDADWEAILQQLKKHENIELWVYKCPWAQTDDKSHIGTFGVFMRFLPMTDPKVEVTVSKNVELLTSPKEARLLHDWDNSEKKYFVLYNPTYFCKYRIPQLCEETEMTGVIMIPMGGFAMKGCVPDLMEQLYKEVQKSDMLKRYVYGFEEIAATKIFKPLMTLENTYIILRENSNQVWPSDNRNYDEVFQFIYDYMAEDSNFSVDELEILRRVMPSEIITFKVGNEEIICDYPPERIAMFVVMFIGVLGRESPDIVVKIFKRLDRWLFETLDYEDLERLCDEMTAYYFSCFKNNVIDSDNIPFTQVRDPITAKKMVYISLKKIFLEDIDWPGLNLKGRNFPTQKSRVLNVEEEMKRIRKVRPYITKNKTEDEIKAIILKEHEDALEKDRLKHEENIRLFLRNLKNMWILHDVPYL